MEILMNKEYKINYVFHIQSPEDFHNQLHCYADQVNDIKLAKQMLNKIGVNV